MEMAKMENNEIKNSKLIPRLRFPGFEGEWEEKSFGELYEKHNVKNDLSFGVDKIISVANMYYKGDAAVSDDEYLKTYNIFRLGDIAYEGNKSANYAYGRFVENTIGDGIVSHVFDVYSPISSDHNIDYWKYAINYERIMRPILEKSTIKSTMMTNLIAKDFLKQKILVPPSLAEQQKIASCLSELDNLIAAQGQKVDALKEKKKGLMQQLFPQPGETTPRLRFPGFEGEWEEKKIGEVADVLQGFGFPDKYQGQKVGELPFCKVGDISVAVDRGERTIYRAANYVDYSLLPILHAKPIPVGATIFAKIGEAIRSNKRIKTGVPCLIDNNTAAVKAKNGEIDDFMFYLMSKVKLADYSGGIVPSVNKSTIEIIPILLPPSPNEQQKIASCLSSLDYLIAAESAKVEALKDHKKGLMQQLFPQPTK